MAYSNRQKQEHPSRTIVKTIQSAEQSGNWPRLMLLCGKEDFLIDWSKNHIKKKLVNPATEALDCNVFSDDATDPYEIIAACETLPIMSQKKLVIANGTELFAKQAKGIDSESIEALTKYIPTIPESTLLLFYCSKPNKAKALFKAVEGTGLIYDFSPLEDADLSRWMVKRLKSAGKTANVSDLIGFARACGYGDSERNYTLFNLENDLKKIIAASESEFISAKEMEALASAQGELNAFKLLDSAFSGRKNDAFEILNSTLEVQQPSKEMNAIMSFIGLICSQLELMLEAREREAEKQSVYEIQSKMKVHEYRLKKALAASRNKSIQQLRKALDAAFQMEKDIKNGALASRTALEMFIATL